MKNPKLINFKTFVILNEHVPTSNDCYLLHHLRLEEPGQIDDRGQNEHWDDVLEEPPPASLGAVDGLTVVDRVVNGDVPGMKCTNVISCWAFFIFQKHFCFF